MHMHVIGKRMKEEITKIYINPLTVNSIKLLLLCNALKIQPQFQKVALNKGEQRQEAFLALNPDGKVPVLQQNDYLLTESNAIMQYLAASHKSSLWPQDTRIQAHVLRVLFWQSNYFFSGVAPITHRKVVLPYWGFDESKIDEQQWQSFDKALRALENILNDSRYLVGDMLTIADISYAAFFIFHKRANMPLQDYPKVQSWLANLVEHDWYVSTESYLNKIITN